MEDVFILFLLSKHQVDWEVSSHTWLKYTVKCTKDMVQESSSQWLEKLLAGNLQFNDLRMIM